MAENNSILSNITNLFGGKRKHLENIKQEDLDAERIVLEGKERQIETKLEDLERQKADLFKRGAKTSSDTERTRIARQIQEVDNEIKSHERMRIGTTKQKRVIKGLILLKKEQSYMHNSNISTVVNRLDLATLSKWIEDRTVDGELQLNRMQELLDGFDSSDSLRSERGEDSEISDLVQKMALAHSEADNPDALDQHYQDFNDTQKSKKDQESEEGI